AGLDRVLPGVPGAGDELAATLAAGERAALVVADVGDGVRRALVEEEGDPHALQHEDDRAAVAQVLEADGSDPARGVGHGSSSGMRCRARRSGFATGARGRASRVAQSGWYRARERGSRRGV